MIFTYNCTAEDILFEKRCGLYTMWILMKKGRCISIDVHQYQASSHVSTTVDAGNSQKRTQKRPFFPLGVIVSTTVCQMQQSLCVQRGMIIARLLFFDDLNGTVHKGICGQPPGFTGF